MKRLHAVIVGIVLFAGLLGYVSVKLAMRDAGNAADFVFKVFGAFMALLIATVGPFGMIGMALFRRKSLGFSAFTIFLSAGITALLLLAYVLYRFEVFSFF